jgi:hypothetical protein
MYYHAQADQEEKKKHTLLKHNTFFCDTVSSLPSFSTKRATRLSGLRRKTAEVISKATTGSPKLHPQSYVAAVIDMPKS